MCFVCLCGWVNICCLHAWTVCICVLYICVCSQCVCVCLCVLADMFSIAPAIVLQCVTSCQTREREREEGRRWFARTGVAWSLPGTLSEVKNAFISSPRRRGCFGRDGLHEPIRGLPEPHITTQLFNPSYQTRCVNLISLVSWARLVEAFLPPILFRPKQQCLTYTGTNICLMIY